MSYSNEEKAMWLDDWRKSGKKAWAYARENGLIPQTFVGWTKRKTKAEQDFVEISHHAYQGQKQIPGIIIEKGDIKIHLPQGMSKIDLCTVIESLRVAL